jgi:hypothetical protein
VEVFGRERRPKSRSGASAWPAPEPRRRAGGNGGRGDAHLRATLRAGAATRPHRRARGRATRPPGGHAQRARPRTRRCRHLARRLRAGVGATCAPRPRQRCASPRNNPCNARLTASHKRTFACPPRVSALPLAPRLALDADDRVTANGARGRPRLRAGEGAGSQAARSEAALTVISTLRRGRNLAGRNLQEWLFQLETLLVDSWLGSPGGLSWHRAHAHDGKQDEREDEIADHLQSSPNDWLLSAFTRHWYPFWSYTRNRRICRQFARFGRHLFIDPIIMR